MVTTPWLAGILLQVDTVWVRYFHYWNVHYSLTNIYINSPVLTYNFVHRLSLHVQDTGVRGHQGM